jgi:hypothetical protein
MSRSLGPHLPEPLLARLLAPDRADRLGQVVVLATPDPYGWPHPALVSYTELRALDASRIRLALYAGSRSTRHLRDSGRATLVFADAELSLYVKAEALALPDVAAHPDLARFELVVKDVLEDHAEGEETGAHLSGGITVDWPGGIEAAMRRHARLRQALES